MNLVSVLVTILVAVLAYWLLVPALGLPSVVGVVAAILILIVGLTGGRF